MMDHRGKTSLKKICLSRVSLAIWDGLQNETFTFFKDFTVSGLCSSSLGTIGVTKKLQNNYYSCYFALTKKWTRCITNEALKRIPAILPFSLQEELKFYVGLISWKIFGWYDYVIRNMSSCIPDRPVHIFKDCFGRFDEIRTMQAMDNSNLLLKFKLACDTFQKGEIDQLWPEVKSIAGICQISEYDLFDSQDFASLYWISVMRGEETTFFEHYDNVKKLVLYSYYQWYSEPSVEEGMFIACLQTGLIFGLKFFWEKLTYDQQRTLIELWERVQSKMAFKIDSDQSIHSCLEVLTFLLTKMQDELKCQVPMIWTFYLELLMVDWPGHELLPDALEEAEKFVPGQIDYRGIIQRVSLTWYHSPMFEPNNFAVVQESLRVILDQAPEDQKKMIYQPWFITELTLKKRIKILEIILKYRGLTDEKKIAALAEASTHEWSVGTVDYAIEACLSQDEKVMLNGRLMGIETALEIHFNDGDYTDSENEY